MKLQTQFGPLTIGEIDNFAFDFTSHVGNSTLTAAVWRCIYTPTGGDPTPQTRILSTQLTTRLYVRSPIDGQLLIRDGFFAVATIGEAPPLAAGGTYTIGVLVTATDPNGGIRYLDLSADVPCQRV